MFNRRTYHLLAKVNLQIRQFDIVTKSDDSLRLQKSFFNLRNEIGEFLFNSTGISATSLCAFINSHELQQQFPFQLDLNKIKIFGQAENTLAIHAFKSLLIQNPSLTWLPNLPNELQDKALLYFLDTFISNLHHTTVSSFLTDTLFTNQSRRYIEKITTLKK